MTNDNVVIACRDCEFRESFPNLGRARLALDAHASAQGHDVDWQINRVDAGVEQAGADAGVCGISGCENPDSPLLDHVSSADEAGRHADPDRNVDDGGEESAAEPPVDDR